jgi:SAM-dependent methyltransferase
MTPVDDITYDPAFFKRIVDGSIASARRVVPLVIDLVHPATVVDVGCGTGAWLSVFESLGCDVTGVDGSYVDRNTLVIPQSKFVSHDLTTPLKLDRQFDLVCSLEVAEHLPESRAESFVKDLCSLGPVVLFSAAIPGQGGLHHINEQWQDYWADFFANNGYAVFDPIRGQIWMDQTVQMHYRQNILLFVRQSHVDQLPKLRDGAAGWPRPLRVVHPEIYSGLHGWFSPQNITLSRAARQLITSLGNSVRHRLGLNGSSPKHKP